MVPSIFQKIKTSFSQSEAGKKTVDFLLGGNSFKAAIICLLSAPFLSGPVTAAPLDITNIVGGWSNPTGGQNVSISNAPGQATDSITWGDGVMPDSGYQFTPGADILAVPVNTNVLLGTFVHNNVPIPGGTGISSVDYDLGFSTNGIPVGLSTILEFDHNETPNAPGPPLSDDIVTVAAATLDAEINVGGDTFFFNLLGFSLDGGNSFSTQFSSPEGGSNSVQLYGVITDVPQQPIPEPGTMALMGLGIVSLIVGYRRKIKKA